MRTYSLIVFFSALFTLTTAQQTDVKWQASLETQKVFIENKSQFDGQNKLPGTQVLFATERGPSQILFTKNGLTFRFDKKESKYQEELAEVAAGKKPKAENEAEEHEVTYKRDVVQLTWENANPNAVVEALDPVTYCYNFAFGDRHIDNARAFRKIIYRNLYPGIDVVYSFHAGEGIKYALIIHPNADVNQVKMKYTDVSDVSIDGENNIHLPTKFGDIVDHAPVTFYEGNEKGIISSGFVKSGKTVGFELGSYDHSKTVVIDPWTVSPSMPNSNKVFEIEADANGNAYIYGGDSPFKLQKYNSAGALQWTFTNGWDSSGYWVGTLLTDPSGNSIITAGSTAKITKVNTSGSQVWTANGGAADEYWSMAYNCDYTKLIVGGTRLTGLFNPTGSGRVFDINVNNGSVSNNALVATYLQGFVFHDPNEVRSICPSPNGNYYFLTLDTIGSITSALNINYSTLSGYRFAYGSPSYGFTPQGQHSIRATSQYIYTSDGVTLQKRDIGTGAVLNSVTIPTGSMTSGGFGAVGTAPDNSGIAIDSCGNVYVGGQSQVTKFDANLNVLSSAATPAPVYDVAVGVNGEILACGQGFAIDVNMTACAQVQAICVTTFSAAAAPTNITCNGQCNGSATATPTNGSGPYSYAWSNSGTTQTINNLCAGSYTVTITDASSNTAVASVTVTEPAAMGINGTSTNATCGNNNGSATATITSGSGPFTYAWSNSGTTQTISNLAAGNYTVTVTGAGGCTVTTNISVTASSGVVASATATSATCGNSNGTATANVTSGTGPYTYAWSNSGTGQTISNLAAGNYTVTVTGAGNCTTTASVSVTATTGLTLSATSTDAACGNNNGTATATVTAGTGPYTYAWSNSGTTQSISNLGAGTYTVTVTGTGGCSATGTVSVTATAGLALTATGTDATCGNSNGSATVNVTAGTGPYTYAWSNSGATQTINSLNGGTYTVTVTGTGNCTATASVTVSTSNALTLAPTSTNASCGNNNGTATATVTAGTGPYTYTWSNSGTTQTISNLSSGSYTVTVTGSGGCSVTASINVGSSSGLSAAFTITQPSCGQNNGVLNCNGVTGGSGNINVNWSLNGSSVGTTNQISNLAGGTYTFHAVDGSGCSLDTSFTLLPSTPGSVTINADKTIMCSGDSAYICAPVGYSAYQWNTGATTQCIYTQLAGNYYVTVTDAGNCTVSSNHLAINVRPLPPVSISVNGDTLTSYHAVTYQWYLNGSPINGATSATYIAGSTGNYQVLISDSNGCYALSNMVNITKLGINTLEEFGVKVYPNPTSMQGWYIELPAELVGSKVEVFDDRGRIVYVAELKDEKSEINFNAAQGVYVLRINSPGKTFTQKLIKL